MTACTDPECARLRAELRESLLRALSDLQWRQEELDEFRRLRTLGGPPPPVDSNWANETQPGALRPEYAHLADRHGGRARTSGTTGRTTP